MNETLFVVPLTTMTEEMLYTVFALTPNDARLKAGRYFENYHNLMPAKWEDGLCGSWVRTQLLSADPDAPIEELDDGMRCRIGKPYKLEMM